MPQCIHIIDLSTRTLCFNIFTKMSFMLGQLFMKLVESENLAATKESLFTV